MFSSDLIQAWRIQLHFRASNRHAHDIRGFKQQLSVPVPAKNFRIKRRENPKLYSSGADQLKSRFLLIGTSISKKNIRKYVRKLAGTDTDSYCLNPLLCEISLVPNLTFE